MHCPRRTLLALAAPVAAVAAGLSAGAAVAPERGRALYEVRCLEGPLVDAHQNRPGRPALPW